MRDSIMKKVSRKVSSTSISTLGVAKATCSITEGDATTTSRVAVLPVRRAIWRLRSFIHARLLRSSAKRSETRRAMAGTWSTMS